MDYLVSTLFIGTGATIILDLWSITRQRVLGIPAPNYGLVGRWIAYMPQGKFRHNRITATKPVRGEQMVGWTAHYLIGIAFAAILTGVWGPDWVYQPTLAPALIVGIGTVLAPFLLMQPGMGAGFFASRQPKPSSARIQSLVTHTVFGLGLYIAGCVMRFATTL